MLAATMLAGGQEMAAQEQQVKAAYLYKFGGYVEWPEEAFDSTDSPVVIAVAGDAGLAEEIGRVVGKRTLIGRPVIVREVRPGDDIGRTHILFVARSQLSRMSQALAQPQPVLVVTDAANGLEQGSIINFVMAENRVRFEVSLEAAKRNSLKIAAPLLTVAMRVQ